MNVLTQAPAAAQAQRFLLRGIGWKGYQALYQVLGEFPGLKLTYDRGNLELMSPLPIHERFKTWFGRLVDMLAEEADIAVVACGSATFSREDLDRGIEPGECFYFARAARVRNWPNIDLAVDPAPDLAVEVEITKSALDRMGIYAGLGVPEVWRFDGETLQVFRLLGGQYGPSSRSVELPFVPLDEFVSFVQQAVTVQDDRPLLRQLRAWVRQRVVPLRQAQLSLPRLADPGGQAPTP
jgi:Uma2 family endonuclease